MIDYKLLTAYSTILDTTTYSKLSLTSYNTKILNRGLQNKTYAELKQLATDYPIWIEEQKLKLAETKDLEDIANINNKLKRLVDKYACTLKEIDIRDRNLIVRQVL
jgi:hypothetical protein